MAKKKKKAKNHVNCIEMYHWYNLLMKKKKKILLGYMNKVEYQQPPEVVKTWQEIQIMMAVELN